MGSDLRLGRQNVNHQFHRKKVVSAQKTTFWNKTFPRIFFLTTNERFHLFFDFFLIVCTLHLPETQYTIE